MVPAEVFPSFAEERWSAGSLEESDARSFASIFSQIADPSPGDQPSQPVQRVRQSCGTLMQDASGLCKQYENALHVSTQNSRSQPPAAVSALKLAPSSARISSSCFPPICAFPSRSPM